MIRLRMRPRFNLAVPAARARVLDVVERRLKERDCAVGGWVQQGQAELHLTRDTDFFSPVLHLALEGHDPARSLSGRFGPLPQVWILFVGIYFILALLGIAALMWGVSQWMLGHPPWALWGVPASAAIFAFVYGAAFIGQGLASEQMYELRTFVDHALEAAERDAPPAV